MEAKKGRHSHTHTYTHTYTYRHNPPYPPKQRTETRLYIYIYVYVCVCVCARARACVCVCSLYMINNQNYFISIQIFHMCVWLCAHARVFEWNSLHIQMVGETNILERLDCIKSIIPLLVKYHRLRSLSSNLK